MTCGACGNPLREGQAFCGRCGKPQKPGSPAPGLGARGSEKSALVPEPPDPGPLPASSGTLWSEKPADPAPKPKSDSTIFIPVPARTSASRFQTDFILKLAGPLLLAAFLIGIAIIGKNWSFGKLNKIYMEKGVKACGDHAVDTLQKAYQTQYSINAEIKILDGLEPAKYIPEQDQVHFNSQLDVVYSQMDRDEEKIIRTVVAFRCVAQRLDSGGKSIWKINQMHFIN